MDGENSHFTAATAGAGVGTLTGPAAVVMPSGIVNGSTRYDYMVVLRDYNGALSAASPAGTTLAGAQRSALTLFP